MTRVGDLIQTLADIEVKQPEIMCVRRVDDVNNTIDAEFTSNPEFDINNQKESNTKNDIKLTVDDEEFSVGLPAIGSFVLVAWAEDDEGYVIITSRMTDVVTKTSNDVLTDANNVNIQSVDKTSIEAGGDIVMDCTKLLISLTEKIKISNGSEDMKSILEDIVSLLSNVITTFNAHLHSGGTINGSTGVPASLITDTSSEIETDIDNLME